MKSGRLMRTIAIAMFAVLTISARLAAQEQQEGKKEQRRYAVIDLGTLGWNDTLPFCGGADTQDCRAGGEVTAVISQGSPAAINQGPASVTPGSWRPWE